jgi:hypothetical protein
VTKKKAPPPFDPSNYLIDSNKLFGPQRRILAQWLNDYYLSIGKPAIDFDQLFEDAVTQKGSPFLPLMKELSSEAKVMAYDRQKFRSYIRSLKTHLDDDPVAKRKFQLWVFGIDKEGHGVMLPGKYTMTDAYFHGQLTDRCKVQIAAWQSRLADLEDFIKLAKKNGW